MSRSLISFTLSFALLFLAAVPNLNAQNRRTEPLRGETRGADLRQKYLRDRLETLAKLADLTEEEMNFVSTELSKYDANRLELYKKSRGLREDMKKSGLTDKEYRELLKQVLQTDLDRTKETIALFDRLGEELSPEKSAKIYTGLRAFNSNLGRRLRERN